MARDVKVAIVGDSSGLRKATEDAHRSLGSLTRSIGPMGVAVGVMAANVAASVGRMGLSAIKAGIKTAASMEQADIAFTSLLGSGQKAQAFLAKLSSFAASTPFELPGLIDASRQLIGVGQSADSVIPTLTAFGDASGALGLSQDNFNHIMMATTQAMSAGTLHAGDLMQMTEAGLPVWKLMSEALGKPVAVLKDMSAKGKLLTKDVMPKLQAQMEKDYGGSMAKQSQTLTGLWSTLMDTFNQGMAKALIPMEPMLRSAIPAAAKIMGKALSGVGTGAADFFGGLSGHVKQMNQSDRPKLQLLGLGIRGMAAAFRDGDVTSSGFVGGMEKVGVAARKVADVLSGVFAKALSWLKVNGPVVFGGLLESLKNLASIALPLVIDAWNAFKEPLTELIRFLVAIAIPALVSITGWMAQHKTIVQSAAVAIGAIVAAVKIWHVVQRTAIVLQKIWNWEMKANPIGLVILAIVGLAAAFVYAYKHSETFRRIVNGAFASVKAVVVGVFNWFKTNWPLLLAILTGPIGLAVLVITRNWDKIKGGATAAKDWIVGAFNGVLNFFKQLPKRMGGMFVGMFDGIKSAFRSAINWVIRGWNGLEFTMPAINTHLPGVGKVGGFTVGVPDIPQLASGGVVRATPGGRLALLGEGGRDEAVVPLSRGGGFGGGDTYNITVNGALDTAGVGKQLETILLGYKRNNSGRLAFV